MDGGDMACVFVLLGAILIFLAAYLVIAVSGAS